MYYKYESEILSVLKENSSLGLDELSRILSIKKDALFRPLASLEQKGLVWKEEKINKVFEFTEEANKYKKQGLPEVRLYKKIKSGKQFEDLDEDEIRFGIKVLKNLGILEISGKRLHVKDWDYGSWEKFIFNKEDVEYLKKRKLLREIEIKKVLYHITNKGKEFNFVDEGKTTLTSNMIRNGEWKEINFKAFNIDSVGLSDIGKLHPITCFINKIRLIFAEMGFEEMKGKYVESAFWNFDALFQPQDHPARELADTFYLEGQEDIPEMKLVEKVKAEHESKWKYKWDINEAKKRILRTHTTAVSARTLAKLKEAPRKFFCVGRVFRNEELDYKHLAEFYQLEGIVVDEEATFSDLLEILRIFYSKLGFEKIRFRPSYFPFTEPSLEIEVYYEPKKEWIELGGAGIFREEVSKPLCGKYPVLAFGLSIERPLMLLMGINDVRTFYKNDVNWLKETRLDL